MSTLQGKTVFMTGGSRGIGRAIALRAARDGANVAIAAKTADPNPKLSGTIYSVAREIQEAGGTALPLQVDIRDADTVAEAVAKTVETFGGIDVLVNNASAVFQAPVSETPLKRFDLMFDINVRGTFAVSQAAVPHLLAAASASPEFGAHILTLAPKPNLKPEWFKDRTAYTMSKYAMGMTVYGLDAELRDSGVHVNGLWPATTIATEALRMFDVDEQGGARTADIMADAAHRIFTTGAYSGEHLIDERVLRDGGATADDLAAYEVVPGTPLQPDLYLD